MPGGYKNIKPEDNPKPFEHGKVANPTGRPLSIRNQLREILAMDGTMKIQAKHVIKIHDDGSVDILMPKKDMVAMKLMQWAMSSKEGASVRSIQLIMEHLEGRPHQSLNISTDEPINQVQLSDEQFEELMDKLKPEEMK